jgi:hypothetical protein
MVRTFMEYLCQSTKTAHSCIYNLCQQPQDYIAGCDVILLVVCSRQNVVQQSYQVYTLFTNKSTNKMCFHVARIFLSTENYEQKGKVPCMASLNMVAKLCKVATHTTNVC